jgi:Protein of unknown function (DUF1353)
MTANRRETICGLTAIAFSALGVPGNQASAQPNKFGYFVGKPRGRLLDGGFELEQHFYYIDSEGRTWQVRAPHTTDGASIPRIFWPLIGHPFEGKYTYAAVVHDYFCYRRFPSYPQVHRNFYLGMLAKNVPNNLAKTMYLAVLFFGPTWKDPIVPKECDLTHQAFKPKKCRYNDEGPSGVPIPNHAINKENMERFVNLVKAEGFSDLAEQIQQLPDVKRLP